MNVFLRELAAYRKSTIIWAVSLSALLIVYMAGIYPAFTRDVAATQQILSQFPAAVRNALNLSLANFFTIYGFYGFLLGFAMLAGAIQAMNVGTGVISKEVAGKTADFLLSKPVGRARVVTAKLAAALTVILVTNVVWVAVSFLAALMSTKTPLDGGLLLLLASTMFLVQLVFLSLGALFAVSLPKVKSVVSVSLPTVFVLYIIGTLGEVIGNDKVRYLSPFKYFDPNYIISKSSFEGRYVLVGAAVFVVAIAASYVIYLRKDVRAAA